MKNLQSISKTVPTTLVQRYCIVELVQRIEENGRMQGAIISAAILGLDTVEKYMSITPSKTVSTRQQNPLTKDILVELNLMLEDKLRQLEMLEVSILDLRDDIKSYH